MEVSRCSELPPEIWEIVANTLVLRFNPLDPFAHYIRTPSLAALARCNRQLRHVCTPLLYRAILLPRREDASAFFGAIANLVNPFTRAKEKPSQFWQINSISFNQGEDYKLTVTPSVEQEEECGPILYFDFTPSLGNLARLVLLPNLTSLDLSHCIIPDHQFASLLGPAAPLRRTLQRLSIRGSVIWQVTLDFILCYSYRYSLARHDQGFADWLKEMHDEEWHMLHTHEELWDREDEFAAEVYHDYSAFARFVPYNDPFEPSGIVGSDPFRQLQYLDLSTDSCDHDHIICGVFDGPLFPRLQHLEVLERRLGATEEDEGLSPDQIFLLRRSISVSVRSKRAPGVIDVRADPSDYGHSLHYVDLSALNEKQYKEFGDYDGPRLERLVIR